ncbi:hypothetical protein QBC42DRAFT_259482 [Cladorrhinum samala]|uniref:Uncharacterized protein n=1 Tax=Cladorrhinum samala TaxID=585594 RepID=A0AAV9HZV6_9PEZI|nr:hypothetical protein QBC42DRAFT_259482 [Cladorrhinum samala]
MALHFPWSKSKDAGGAKKDAPPPAPPLIDEDDEKFLERLVSRDQHDEGPRPALPPRSKTPDLDLIWDEESETFRMFDKLEDPFAKALVLADAGPSTATTPPDTPAANADKDTPSTEKGKEKEKVKEKDKEKKPSRLSRMFHRNPDKDKKASSPANLEVPTEQSASASPSPSPEKEWADLSRILDKLSLSSSPSPTPNPDGTATPPDSKATILSREARDALLLPFLQILKDLAAGVPTAADDLVSLLDGRNDIISKSFSKLPSSLQKLVTTLPDKLTAKLAPEILAIAAEAQGVDKDKLKEKGVKGLLSQLTLTPALIKTLLRGIMNALRTRWPAFVGTSMLWSLAVTLLLFVLWYCHKRGREEREKKEKEGEAEGDGEEVKGEEVVERVLESEAAAAKEGEQGEGVQGGELVVAVVPPAEGDGARAVVVAADGKK